MDVHQLPHSINLILVGLEAEDRDRIIKLVPDSWSVNTAETMSQSPSLDEAGRVFLYEEGFSDKAHLNGLCAVALSDHRIEEDSHVSMHAKQGEGFRPNSFNWKTLKRSLCEVLENHRLRIQCSLLEDQLFKSQKLESLGVMAAGLAHDFNNMLAGILANVDLAKDYVESGSTMEEFMLGIEKSSLRAADLTRQILLYSGKVLMDSGRTDLNRLISLSEPLIRSAISRKIALEIHSTKEGAEARVQETQVRQLLMTLILGASGRLKDQEGRISIRTGSVHSADREGLNLDIDWGLGNEDIVYFEVESFRIDSAVELSESDAQPSFNGVAHRNEISGLLKSTIDRVLKECCGGAIYQVKSDGEAIYRVFFSTFPTLKAPTTELEDLPDDWKCSGTVLIADDEELVRNAMASFLVSLGMKVLKCSNGREAVRKFQESNADVRFVILDYSMPSLNGLETMKSILNIRPDMKVILSSGYQEVLMQQLPDYAENTFFLSKPFTIEGFFKTVRTTVES